MVGRCTRSSGSMRSTTPSSACRAISASCRSFSTSRFRTSTSITSGWARTSWRMPSPWTRAASKPRRRLFSRPWIAACTTPRTTTSSGSGATSHAEALDLLLTVAIPKNTLDDHYFIFPMFTWRALDWLGREHTPFLMRPAVRYVSRFPTPPPLRDIEPLLDEYELLKRPLRFHTSPDETPEIGRLGEAIARCDAYAEIPRMLAKALAEGLSLQGTSEALSIGAAGLFMRSLTGNPMDVHLHTGANLRRYLLKLEGVSLRNKLLALLTWHTGPEVRSTQNRMEPPPQPNREAVAALPVRTQAALLDALEESIYTQPPTDWSKVTNLGQMRAVPEVKNTVNLAQQYADLGYDPDALISRLARIVVHDNFTEMHAFKHHQATFEEFHATRLPWRWRHLVSAAQASAISYGKNMEIYEEALELLHA